MRKENFPGKRRVCIIPEAERSLEKLEELGGIMGVRRQKGWGWEAVGDSREETESRQESGYQACPKPGHEGRYYLREITSCDVVLSSRL